MERRRKKETRRTKRKKESEREKERDGREEKEREGIWPSPDNCFRFGQPCQPLGLQTERF